MLLHRSGEHRIVGESPRQHRPEAVYIQRMAAWSAVVLAAFVGIELIINNYTVIGVILTTLATVGFVLLRSTSFGGIGKR